MSDRINGLYVTLDKNYKDEDVETIINAISMIKGVLDVKMNVESSQDYFAKQQLSFEIKKKLYDFINRELK